MSKKKKILAVACGGTGGHFYPGLSIARSFIELGGHAILFIGGHNIDEHVEIAKSAGVEAVPVPAVRLPRSPLQLPLFPFRMWSCIRTNQQALKTHKVDLALGMGSWASVPLGIAANRLKIPLALHEGNAVPGQANRFLSKKARLLGLSLPLRDPLTTRAKQISVGMPLRREIIEAAQENIDSAKRAHICTDLGLNPDKPVCLVFGGSQGAKAINDAIGAAMQELANSPAGWQLIHLTGQDDNDERIEQARSVGLPVVILKRDPGIHRYFQIADAVICRAGASTILELAVMKKYPLLIPLPTAKEDHQTANAQCVVGIGGGVMVPQHEFNTDTILTYLEQARVPNTEGNDAITPLSYPNAAESMAQELMKI